MMPFRKQPAINVTPAMFSFEFLVMKHANKKVPKESLDSKNAEFGFIERVFFVFFPHTVFFFNVGKTDEFCDLNVFFSGSFIQWDPFGGIKKFHAKVQVNLREFPRIIVHCLGMIPVLK